MSTGYQTSAPARVRDESPADLPAIRRLHRLAFPTCAEATIVDALRPDAALIVSLVADAGGEIVGHVAFSPLEIVNDSAATTALALAPLAVLPERQRAGIGSALVRTGPDRCRAAGNDTVVVVGHPQYYHRFGSRPRHATKSIAPSACRMRLS